MSPPRELGLLQALDRQALGHRAGTQQTPGQQADP